MTISMTRLDCEVLFLLFLFLRTFGHFFFRFTGYDHNIIILDLQNKDISE